MSKIRIVNWLLTRRCNLNCDYCAIVKNYTNKPAYYPDMSHYHQNEMSTETVIKGLENFYKHNPYAFHIFYGGEPLLRKDLPEIIKYCNDKGIYYTIISNNTPGIQPLIKNLFNKCGKIEGFTSSVDPVLNDSKELDRVFKSIEGLKRLKEMQEKGFVKDIVAEITVMKQNINSLSQLVSILSNEDIYSDITFIDIAKSNYYDFSNVYSQNLLIERTFDIAKQLVDIYNNEKYLVHMKDVLIPKMYDILPSELDCKIEDGLHNVSVDADGTIRLCLRIRGVKTPNQITLNNLLVHDGKDINEYAMTLIKNDKYKYCLKCNHTCLIMSKHIDDTSTGEAELIHTDKRESNENKN